MPVNISLNAPEHLQLALLSDGVRELNESMTKAGLAPAVLVSKEENLCTQSGTGDLIDLTVDALAALIRPTCVPGKIRTNKDDPEESVFVPEPCLPRSLLRAYMETKSWKGIPRVKQTARAPIVRPDFTIRWTPGWDEPTSCWVLKGLPENRYLIDIKFDIRDVYSQFPLIDRALVADALAAAFSPLLTTALSSPIPSMIVSARKISSGKTELAKTCSMLGNGGKTITTWPGNNELKKMIETYVVEDNRVVIFDNIKDEIDSQPLESVITARSISYRKMYTHKSSTIQSNTIWMMTANGAVASPDMVRRSIVIMLDKDAHPRGWDETWPAWVEANEAALVTLMCSMIENWRLSGCRPGTVRFDNFQEWAGVVSGILEANGIAGMWEAREQVVADAIQTDDEDDMPIVEALAETMGGGEWSSGELWKHVNDPWAGMDDGGSAAAVRTWLASTGKVSKNSTKPSIPVGRALHGLVGKTFDGCGMILEARMKEGRRLYRLRKLDGTAIPEITRRSAGEGFKPM